MSLVRSKPSVLWPAVTAQFGRQPVRPGRAGPRSSPTVSPAGRRTGSRHVVEANGTDRRCVVHFSVTPYPTARWTAQQVVEAFPFDTATHFLIRDHDGIYSQDFRERVKHMGLEEVVIAYRAPWQSAYVERLIGSIRRECLDHLIVFNEAHLLRILRDYFAYYHVSRTHLSLERNAPVPRQVESPECGKVIAISHVGGLHHRYTRAAA